MKDKKAILVASFGTSYKETCEKNIGGVEAAVAAAFPGWEIRRAFTSGMIIRKLRTRDGITVNTVEEALEQLEADGYETVVVQPTHLLNGIESFGVAATVDKHRHRFRQLVMGAPLLTSTGDFRSLAEIVSDVFPPIQEKALCLMGHGSAHFADTAYAALEYHFRDLGRTDVFVGTVEGYPDLSAMLRQIRKSPARGVVLTPLMLVAGDHATNDLAGPGEESWKTVFEQAGFPVTCILKGLGEYEPVRQLYVRHVREAIDTMASESAY